MFIARLWQVTYIFSYLKNTEYFEQIASNWNQPACTLSSHVYVKYKVLLYKSSSISVTVTSGGGASVSDVKSLSTSSNKDNSFFFFFFGGSTFGFSVHKLELTNN